jgi:homoserine O-acetyltransferase/O-succinyltransferase
MSLGFRQIVVRVTLSLLGLANANAQMAPPAVASLGTCRLESGASIPNCRVAYRVFGRLDESRSNAVLIPTWLRGRSEDWISLLGRDGLVDTTRYFAIVVDAFANGRSSSPSNTPRASQPAFRDLTIGDMVESQYRLLTERLQVPRLHAVVGISMGGVQAFEWAVRYPTFARFVIPIVGSPRLAPFDRVLWTTILHDIETGRLAGFPDDSIWIQVARIQTLVGQTPMQVNRSSVAEVEKQIADEARASPGSWELDDYVAQLRAIRRHDISARFGSDLSEAAKAVRARMLVVYSWDDHVVTADPAAAFARLARADTLSVPSPCGHVFIFCEKPRVSAAVRDFLAR